MQHLQATTNIIKTNIERSIQSADISSEAKSGKADAFRLINVTKQISAGRSLLAAILASAAGSLHTAKLMLVTRLAAAAAILCFLGAAIAPMQSYAAASWLSMSEDTTAEAAIVMDADSGAVLWGKNIDAQYTPASITKLMTGLLVLENCSLDEEVTVAAEAVNNLEAGASSVGLGAGDVLTVDELLHAMLLRSANDAANALACHVSGSIDAFAVLMTERAAELGCKGTIFRNPSGLTTPENVTTAYDMALIGAACAENPGFVKVESRLSYKISGDSKYPDGFTVNQEHKMLLSGTGYTDSRVIGGKTGFIKASGNTLVTIAEDNGMKLVAVVLKDKNPDHYKDTKKLLDFGFNNFERITVNYPIATYGVADRLLADKIISEASQDFGTDGEVCVTIPKGGDISELKVSYDYNMDESAPEGAIAKMSFGYGGVKVGSTYIMDERVSDISLVETEAADRSTSFTNVSLTKIIIIGLIVVVLIATATLVLINAARAKEAREQRQRRLERRRRRLKELNVTEDEFMDMVKAEHSLDRPGSGSRQSSSRRRPARHSRSFTAGTSPRSSNGNMASAASEADGTAADNDWSSASYADDIIDDYMSHESYGGTTDDIVD